MDPIVQRAMAKWPNVPSVYGWLSLDRRGRWRLRGERLGNKAANQFISRNYASDDAGCWYFQNGPQRVFITLENTPWVLRLNGEGEFTTHTELPVTHIKSVWMNEHYDVMLETEHGLGMVSDQDLPNFVDTLTGHNGPLDDTALETGLMRIASGGSAGVYLPHPNGPLQVCPIGHAEVPSRFEFVRTPAAPDSPGTPSPAPIDPSPAS